MKRGVQVKLKIPKTFIFKGFGILIQCGERDLNPHRIAPTRT